MADNEVWIYAHDYSGSTAGIVNYFEKAKSYLQKFQIASRSSNNVYYLLWSEICQNVGLDALNRFYERLSGNGGTEPGEISQWIIKNKLHKKNINLWLITDGEIVEHSVLKCKSLNFRINFKSLVLVTINPVVIDNSVSFAFFNSNCVISMYEEIASTFKQIDLNTVNYDFSQIRYENFSQKLGELENYVISKYTVDFSKLLVNKSVKEKLELEVMAFVEQLKKKRLMLVKDCRRIEGKQAVKVNFELSNKSSLVIEKLKTMQFYQDLHRNNERPESYIVTKIDALISFIHNNKKGTFSFEELKKSIHQQKFDQKVDRELEELPDVEFEELTTEVNFYDCLSLFESDSPIICFNKVNYIVDNVRKNNQFFIQMIDYPFVLIDNKEFLNKKSFICQTYDCETFKEYLNFGYNDGFPVTDPLTRAELVGGIIPYEFADAWNDFSISSVLLNGKRVKQSFYDLIYFVLYRKLSQMQHIDRSVLKQLKEYAFYRIQKEESKLTFSSLPLEPQEVVPIPIALFYCAQLSSELFGENPVLFKNEKLRNFCFTSQHIIQILKHFKMDLNEDFIKKRSDLFVHLNKMKSMTPDVRSTFIFSSIFRFSGGFLTNSLIAPENFYKINYLEESLNAPVNFKSKKVNLNSIKDKVMFYYTSDKLHPDVKICEKTGRPLYMVNGKPFYISLCKILKRLEIKDNSIVEYPFYTTADIDFQRLLSMSKIYIRYVTVNKKYPLFSGLKEFLLKYKSFNETGGVRKICLFPADISDYLKETLTMYEPIKEKILVADYIALTKESVSIEKKKIMEKAH